MNVSQTHHGGVARRLVMAIAFGGAAVTLLFAERGRVTRSLDLVRDAPQRLLGRFVPPAGGRLADLSATERQALERLAPQLDGTIVWSSNREDHHHIYVIDVRTRLMRRLTKDPHVDSHPRLSPDGSRVVFMRGQRPWVSLRDEVSWDVYVIDVAGTNERRLSRSAFAPFWSPDGRSVTFSRGNQALGVDVSTGRERILLDADREIPGAQIAGANLSKDERRLAFSIRGRADGVAAYGLDRHRLTLVDRDACQIVWAPDGSLVWVANGGEGGTRIMTSHAGTNSVLMDLPGRRSHEYFPKVSNDGSWLIWAAAAEGHEHDRADYELFLWKIGTPWTDATRVTYGSSNNNYPDVFVRGAK